MYEEDEDDLRIPYTCLNEAAIYNPSLAKGTTEVWYAKDPEFTWFSFLKVKPTKATLKDTHILLGNVAFTDPEEVFRAMQGDRWSPRGEARELIRRKGLVHTSMSVGDIIVIEGKALYVDHAGFKTIEEK